MTPGSWIHSLELHIMETNTEVCESFTSEELPLTTNLITLPAELVVYIMSFLIIHDRIRLRYVSRRLRRVSEVAALWNEFVWPYFENQDEHYVSGTLKACGEHVKQLIIRISMPSAKLVWVTENCVNVTQLCLPRKVHFHPTQLEKIVSTMTHLKKLDVCWSDNIEPLLEICATTEELTIRIKNFKNEPPEWDLEEWIKEGIHFPPIVKIYTKFEYFKISELFTMLSKYYTLFPPSEITVYSSTKIPINIHPKLPLLRFELGPTAVSSVVKASNYGILGLRHDMVDVLELNCDGKVMHGASLSLLSGPQEKRQDLGFPTLSSITFFIVGFCHGDMFPGHLEQIAIACPNLQWINLKGCDNCLRSLKGLQSIVNNCQNLQGLNIADIPVMDVESYVLLWRLISRMTKLTHLTISLCLLIVPDHVRTERMINFFQRCHNLQALEIQYGLCRECDTRLIDDLLLSHFPSLIYCNLECNNSHVLHHIMTTCKKLKYLSYSNYVDALPFPLSCVCQLQQLCIESRYSNVPDYFMNTISSHGGLEHVILCVESITVNGIYTIIRNSPNLVSFCAFIKHSLCKNGRKLKSKDFKPKAKKEFCHHKLFRVAIGNPYFFRHRNDVLTELNTDLSSLWSEISW